MIASLYQRGSLVLPRRFMDDDITLRVRCSAGRPTRAALLPGAPPASQTGMLVAENRRWRSRGSR